jgi:hypothetical protein
MARKKQHPAAAATAQRNSAQRSQALRAAIYSLAAKGLIYDTGERRWPERTQSFLIVWKAISGKRLDIEMH